MKHNSVTGHFVEAVMSNARWPLEHAIMNGPVVPAENNSEFCLSFWYQLVVPDAVSFVIRNNNTNGVSPVLYSEFCVHTN